MLMLDINGKEFTIGDTLQVGHFPIFTKLDTETTPLKTLTEIYKDDETRNRGVLCFEGGSLVIVTKNKIRLSLSEYSIRKDSDEIKEVYLPNYGTVVEDNPFTSFFYVRKVQ